MTGKHRNLNFKPMFAYAVGTKLRLEKIIKEDNDTNKHLIQVRAKKGGSADVYVLYASEPKNYVGKLVEVSSIEKDFMRNTYYMKPVDEMIKVKRASS